MAPRLILASASPRRAQILRDAGFSFAIRPTSVDESVRGGESPEKHVQRLAREKAMATVNRVSDSAVVIGADTVVVVGGNILGKPHSRADARRMLRLISGRRHRVLTGLAVLHLGAERGGRNKRRSVRLRSATETTAVWFARLSRREIEEYVASGEPMDKAGAYAIQGRAGCFITRIEGCYFNVVGLPLARLYGLLLELGIHRG